MCANKYKCKIKTKKKNVEHKEFSISFADF